MVGGRYRGPPASALRSDACSERASGWTSAPRRPRRCNRPDPLPPSGSERYDSSWEHSRVAVRSRRRPASSLLTRALRNTEINFRAWAPDHHNWTVSFRQTDDIACLRINVVDDAIVTLHHVSAVNLDRNQNHRTARVPVTIEWLNCARMHQQILRRLVVALVGRLVDGAYPGIGGRNHRRLEPLNRCGAHFGFESARSFSKSGPLRQAEAVSRLTLKRRPSSMNVML